MDCQEHRCWNCPAGMTSLECALSSGAALSLPLFCGSGTARQIKPCKWKGATRITFVPVSIRF
jgi:hypothetical protein